MALTPPKDFVQSALFPGFQQNATGATILINELPAPSSEVVSGMTADRLATRAMTLITSEDVKCSGFAGKLLEVSQVAAGVTYKKWITVFGNESATVTVTATYPLEQEEMCRDVLKTAVMSSQWNPNDTVETWEGLSFRVDEVSPLKVSMRLANSVMMTREGSKPPKKPEEPLLAVGASIGEARILDVEKFAREYLKRSALKDVDVLDGKHTKFASMDGYELTARCRDKKTDTRLFAYLVILPGETQYYFILGYVGEDLAKEFEPIFRTAAKSFRLAE